MKVLYAGELTESGTCFSRLVAMRRLHDSVITFDDTPFQNLLGKAPRWQRELFYRRFWREANESILKLCQKEKPSILWLDKSEWITNSTLQSIRDLGVYTVRHITDALYPKRPLYMRLQRYYLRHTMDKFDVIFTTNERDAQEYRARSGQSVILTDLGYDDRRFHARPLDQNDALKWASNVLFVGHYEPRTEQAVLALLRAGVSVTVHGSSRWFRSPLARELGDHLKPSLNDRDYEAALKAAKIGLCVVSEWNYNETAARSFELPASGTFLLAIRTPHHSRCYLEGVEAEFFATHDELVQKAKRYLGDDEARRKVAAQGQQRCANSGYSWNAIMERDWQTLMNHYQQR
jgi:spore maturation protein CgeB